MKYALLLALLIFLPVTNLRADPPTVTLPEKISGDAGPPIRVKATISGIAKSVMWVSLDPGLFVFPPELLKDSMTCVCWSTTPGVYRLMAYTGNVDGPSLPAICTITIGTPIPPVPPTPPTPPTPPSPIPDQGLRVLVVYKATDLGKLTADQANILASTDIRSYLRSKCVMGPDSKTPEYRFWDLDKPPGNDSPAIGKLLALPRKSVPWVVISTGKAGFQGPLPPTINETMALLKKYGG